MDSDLSFEFRSELLQRRHLLRRLDTNLALRQTCLVCRLDLASDARIALLGRALDPLIVKDELIPIHSASFVNGHESLILLSYACGPLQQALASCQNRFSAASSCVGW